MTDNAERKMLAALVEVDADPTSMEIVPMSFKAACKFIEDYHRHHLKSERICI